ncbi:MAG: SEL1-like repeat protein [Verrucomicrobiae bacterium]|nr:SEL1-like repeat protein [Verrucomicrobiae bacterium]
MIHFSCPHCDQRIAAEDSAAGAATQCPACGGEILVPGSSSEGEPEAPAAAVQPASPGHKESHGAPGEIHGHTFAERLKSGAKDGWSGIKRHSKQAAVMAGIEKLRNVDLRKAYHELGKRCFDSGMFERELADSFAAIRELDVRIAEMREKSAADSGEGTMASLKRMGKDAAKASHAQALVVKREHLITEFGKQAFSQHKSEAAAAFPAESEDIERLIIEIQHREKEAMELRAAGVGTRIPTLIVAAIPVLIVLATGAFLLGQNRTASKSGSASQVETGAGTTKKAEDPENPTNPDSQILLGYRYYKGHGVPQDYGEAARWYRKAADQGHSTAQLALGDMYFEGHGFDRNLAEAAKWWRRSALQGDYGGQYKLGVAHAYGVGVPVDKIEAYKWLNLSATSGDEKSNENARREKARLEDEMTTQENREAQRLSRDWKPHPPAAAAGRKRSAPTTSKKSRDATVNQPAFKSKTRNDGKLFSNSLGLKFSQVEIPSGPSAGKVVYFSIWETRRKDYAAYARSRPDEIEDTKWEGVDASLRGSEHPDSPVTFVNARDAGAFCSWLTLKERKQGLIPKDAEYRLPTDHEWSCAVGIGASEDPNWSGAEKSGRLADIYPWGREWPPPSDAGNIRSETFEGKFNGLAPVGSFKPGKFGLFDMAGNVGEIVHDPNAPDVDTLRGSSWMPIAMRMPKSEFYSSLRVSFNRKSPDNWYQKGRMTDVGFRCVLVANEPL